MKLLVLGGTGNTGRRFVRMALKRGHNIVAIVRSTSTAGFEEERKRFGGGLLNLVEGDVLDPSIICNLLSDSGIDAVISCLGIRKENRADPNTVLLSPEDFTARSATIIVDAMKKVSKNEVNRLVVISSAGIGDSWGTVDVEMQKIIQGSNIHKIFLDLNNMEKVLENSGLDTLAVRPVGLVDDDVSNEGAKIVDKFKLTSQISTGDVAKWMLDAVERSDPFSKRTEMIGWS